MEFYPPMGRRDVQAMKEFRGLATTDKFTTNEAYATVAKNLDADDFPAMKTRPSVAQVGLTSPSFVGIAGITRTFASGSEYRLTYGFSASNQKIYMYNYGASPVWSEANPTSGLSGFSDIDYTIYQDKVYAVRIPSVGSSLLGNKMMYVLDGNAVSIISIPEHFHAVESYANRMYGAYGNTIFVSNLGLPGDYSTPEKTGQIILDSNNADIITALKAGNGKLTVFRRDSMYDLLGRTPQNFTPVEVAQDIGCVNHKSVTNLNGVTYFIDKKGVYAYSGGRPRKISDIIDRYFESINWTLSKFAKCSLETDGRRLFVNLGDDVMLVWHSMYNVWTEWNGLNVWSMIFNSNETSFLSTNGNVYEFGSSATPVSWKYISVLLNTGLLARRLRMNRMWLTSDIVNATFHIYVSNKHEGDASGDWTEVKMVTGSGLNSVKTVIHTLIAANAKTLRIKIQGTGDCKIHEIVRESRIFPLS